MMPRLKGYRTRPRFGPNKSICAREFVRLGFGFISALLGFSSCCEELDDANIGGEGFGFKSLLPWFHPFGNEGSVCAATYPTFL